MKIFPLIFILAAHVLQGQTIVPGGYASGEWDATGSPYIVEGDLLVHPDSALTITSGTSVLFRGEFRIEILGQLLVQGTEIAPVSFAPETEGEKWKGLVFNSTDTSITDSSIVKYAMIRDCYQNACLNVISSSRLRVSNSTIRGGNSFRGGGIRCISSHPLFDNLVVEYNTALDGAGISLEGSAPVIRDCMIRQNYADGAGGGMVIFNNSSPRLENCVIKNNFSFGSGGGVYINGSSPVFINCDLLENSGAAGGGSSYSGGAVSVKLGSFTRFENCIFLDNNSNSHGAGIASFSPNEIINCLFAGNHANVSGGALFLSSGNPVESMIINNTICENTSPEGAVLYAHNHVAVMKNCIAWNSDTSDTGSLFWLDAVMALAALEVSYSDVQDGQGRIKRTGNASFIWGPGNVDLDPQFLPESFEPGWDSPCIEAGTPDTSGLALPESDLAGNPRLVNDRIDIGAFEYQLPLIIQHPTFNLKHFLRVFPNPAKDWVVVDFGFQIQNGRFQVVSTEGKVVKEGEFTKGDQFGVELNDISSGLYVLILAFDDKKISKKILIFD
jgi:hypothetical protein